MGFSCYDKSKVITINYSVRVGLMGEKGKRDKGKRETKKKAKLTIKEKRKLKKEKLSSQESPKI
jgi:hypothetical protein